MDTYTLTITRDERNIDGGFHAELMLTAAEPFPDRTIFGEGYGATAAEAATAAVAETVSDLGHH